MTSLAAYGSRNAALAGIGFVILGMVAISINNVLVKQLAGDYSLYQITFIRSAIGICFCLALVQLEGGFSTLRTTAPWLNLARVTLIVVSNMTFFAALAVVPLADATALFFMAPILITLMSIPLLGERVGRLKLTAVAIGCGGTFLMLQPWTGNADRSVPVLAMALPLVAALTYALTQILTRRIGVATSASAMAVYIQAMFIAVALVVLSITGNGQFAGDFNNESMQFLLRGWVWPDSADRYLFVGLGLASAVIAYALSQAYRLAQAATVAPFEYIGLPLALAWGWMIWGELPGLSASLGILLIVAGGVVVFLRERSPSNMGFPQRTR